MPTLTTVKTIVSTITIIPIIRAVIDNWRAFLDMFSATSGRPII